MVLETGRQPIFLIFDDQLMTLEIKAAITKEAGPQLLYKLDSQSLKSILPIDTSDSPDESGGIGERHENGKIFCDTITCLT